MATSDSLAIVTLLVAMVSMTLSSMALWPQWKHAVRVLRDVVLWTALVLVVVGATTIGWRHHRTAQRRANFARDTSQWQQQGSSSNSYESVTWR